MKLFITFGVSVLIHVGFGYTLYQLANKISFLDQISITTINVSAQDIKPKQSPPPQKKMALPKSNKIMTEKNELPAQTPSVMELGSDEVSNQSQISSPAKLISVVRAQRTDAAKKANYVADAKVLIIVNQQGVVDSAKLLNNLEYGLNEVALDIAQKLKFLPARIGSVAIRTQIELTINFKSSN